MIHARLVLKINTVSFYSFKFRRRIPRGSSRSRVATSSVLNAGSMIGSESTRCSNGSCERFFAGRNNSTHTFDVY